MPKEITHWTIAEKTFLQLRDNSHLKETISSHKNLYYIGAVIFDSPFYCLFGKESKKILKVGKYIHNNKNNSFEPIIRILNHFQYEIPKGVWAFISGIVTHITTDSNFHPFINYFSGSKKESSMIKRVRCRHHELETLLDLFFLNNVRLINNGLLSLCYRNKEMEEKEFLKIISILYWGRPDSDTQLIKRAFKLHCRIQKLFLKRWLIQLLKFVNLIPGLNLEEEIALFYPRFAPIYSPFFQSPIIYYHPLTGEKKKKTLAQLVEKSIYDSLQILNELGKNWGSENNIEIFSKHIGPNLNTNLINTCAEDMHFFDTSIEIKKMILEKNAG